MRTFASIGAAAALLAGGVLASQGELVARASKTPPVTVKGNAFYAGSNRFYIRGVDYQPGGSSALQDPIANIGNCTRDIAYFKDLGINVIRVYTVDNTLNHDSCMQALSDAGIYLALDVNSPNYSINRKDPHPSYNDVYLQSVFATIDVFAKYDNTLLFFSGNEVINDNATTSAALYVKAVTRDMKQYIQARKYRSIPVGYSAADVDENRYEMATYMNCGADSERSDFFAFNDYSWCDPSSYQQSGWSQKVAKFGNYSLPLFLSEYGCNTGASKKRSFAEVASLYGTDMTPVYSGGLVYEYSLEEPTNFGLVNISTSGINKLSDYDSLKSALAKTSPPTGDGGYKSAGTPSVCPSKSPTWNVNTDSIPPIPEPAKKFMTSGAGKAPGLQGNSQNAGTTSTFQTTTGSGTGSSSTASSSKGAAAGLNAPEFELAIFVTGLVVLASTMLGMAYIL